MSRGGERDRVKERFWRRVVRQWRQSGQTVRDFCDAHGLAEPSFYAWRRTLAQRDRQERRETRPAASRPADRNGQAELPTFVPVHVTPATAVPLELVLGQRVVRVPAGFDAATLRQLLAVLEGPSC